MTGKCPERAGASRIVFKCSGGLKSESSGLEVVNSMRLRSEDHKSRRHDLDEDRGGSYIGLKRWIARIYCKETHLFSPVWRKTLYRVLSVQMLLTRSFLFISQYRREGTSVLWRGQWPI